MTALEYLREIMGPDHFQAMRVNDEAAALEHIITSHRRLRQWNSEQQDYIRAMPRWKRWLLRKLTGGHI